MVPTTPLSSRSGSWGWGPGKNYFSLAGKDYRVPEFWSVASDYNGCRDQTLPGKGKTKGEMIIAPGCHAAELTGKGFMDQGEMDLRVEDQGISRAADRSNGIVSLVCHLPSYLRSGTPLSPSETRPPVSSARRGGLALPGLPQQDNS